MTTRKDFLAAGALGALAPDIALASTPSPAPSPTSTPVPFPHLDFTLEGFDASLGKPAKHKHLFSSKKVDNGAVFANMEGTIFAYNWLSVPLSDVLLAAVFYHGVSVYFAFDDFIWKKYVMPQLSADRSKLPARVTGYLDDIASVKPKDGNPCLHKTSDEDDQSIETLVAQVGARFYVCNRATQGLSQYIAGQHKLDPVAVYKDFVSHLVPNAMLVPSGVWAVNAVQEHNFTLLAVN